MERQDHIDDLKAYILGVEEEKDIEMKKINVNLSWPEFSRAWDKILLLSREVEKCNILIKLLLSTTDKQYEAGYYPKFSPLSVVFKSKGRLTNKLLPYR